MNHSFQYFPIVYREYTEGTTIKFVDNSQEDACGIHSVFGLLTCLFSFIFHIFNIYYFLSTEFILHKTNPWKYIERGDNFHQLIFF